MRKDFRGRTSEKFLEREIYFGLKAWVLAFSLVEAFIKELTNDSDKSHYGKHSIWFYNLAARPSTSINTVELQPSVINHSLDFTLSNRSLQYFIKPSDLTLANGHIKFPFIYSLKNLMIFFPFQGLIVTQNVSSGIIFSRKNLVLQGVTRHDSGRYSCLVANAKGETMSDPVKLRVQCKYYSFF